MRQKYIVLIIMIVIGAVMIGFIWGNSLQPAAVSNEISGFARRIVNGLFRAIGLEQLTGDSVLRKIAHASEFCLLGIVLSAIFTIMKYKTYSALILSGLFVALTDETLQLFVDGRAGLVKDIWIDLGGFITGCILANAISAGLSLYRRRKRLRKKDVF